MTNSTNCPDCNVEMQAGFVPDHYAQIIQSHWHPGSPDEKTLVGNLKLDKDSMIAITSFRCPQCGQLKQYAMKDT